MAVGAVKAHRYQKRLSIKEIFYKFLIILLKVLPNIFFRKIMESRFIDFGMEITNICNADCTFCGYRYQKKSKSVMTEETYRKTIDDFSISGGGPLTFTPTVGDPLVDPNILEKIKYAKNKKNITSMFLYTNGILLNKFGFENVLKSGLDRIAISTYVGSSEGYFKFYKKKKYETVINNIISILKINQKLNNPCRITLHLRVEKDKATWENSKDFKEIIKYISPLNISYLTVYDSWSERITINDLPDGCTLAIPKSVEEKVKGGPCFELYRRAHVLQDLSVGACVCVDLESEINIGNLENNTLDEIWKGEKLKTHRSNWKEGKLPETCKNCTRYRPLNDFISENRFEIFGEVIKSPFLPKGFFDI